MCRERSEPPCRPRDTQARRVHTLVSWRVQLSNGLTVEVGRHDPMQRVERFVRVYPAILAAANGRLVAVDLRYSNGFAVRWEAMNEAIKGAG